MFQTQQLDANQRENKTKEAGVVPKWLSQQGNGSFLLLEIENAVLLFSQNDIALCMAHFLKEALLSAVL